MNRSEHDAISQYDSAEQAFTIVLKNTIESLKAQSTFVHSWERLEAIADAVWDAIVENLDLRSWEDVLRNNDEEGFEEYQEIYLRVMKSVLPKPAIAVGNVDNRRAKFPTRIESEV